VAAQKGEFGDGLLMELQDTEPCWWVAQRSLTGVLVAPNQKLPLVPIWGTPRCWAAWPTALQKLETLEEGGHWRLGYTGQEGEAPGGLPSWQPEIMPTCSRTHV
jgi:hypothetical protein